MGWFSREETVKLGSMESYANLYDQSKLRDDTVSKNEIKYSINKIMNGREKYIKVEELTGIPWVLVGALHGLEASFNFNTCLHNGDPLPGPTTHVPKGRGPFKDWEDAAIDAIIFESLQKKIKLSGPWTIEFMLYFAERYNGVGYINKGVPSPYIWSKTTAYTRGKYVYDGIYNPFATSKQVGVAAILKHFEKDNFIVFQRAPKPINASAQPSDLTC